MPQESPADSHTDSLEQFLADQAPLVERLHAKAEAARWDLTPQRFARALHRSAKYRFQGMSPRAADVAAYLESLHVEDLALACACSDGNEQAWEHFVRHYRQNLYVAARAIIGRTPAAADEARARDLADSIYADLYGLKQGEPLAGRRSSEQRRSLFDYFHGRSKLSTWLRAVLAQRSVDEFRAARRIEPLEETGVHSHRPLESTNASFALPDPHRDRYVALLHAALLEALGALDPRDRLRLAYYYVQDLTLAQVGRLLGEHEATASRHLERTRRDLRKSVERALRAGRASTGGVATTAGLSEAQIQLCFEYASEEWPFDLTRALTPQILGGKLQDE